MIFSHGASQSTAWLDDATYFQYCAIEEARLLWDGLQKSRMQFSDALQTQYNEFSTAYSQLAQGMSASEQISQHRWDQVGQAARTLNTHLRQSEYENLRKFSIVESAFGTVEQAVTTQKDAIIATERKVAESRVKLDAVAKVAETAVIKLGEQSAQLAEIRKAIDSRPNPETQVQAYKHMLEEQAQQVRREQKEWENKFLSNLRPLLEEAIRKASRPNTPMELDP